MIHWRRDRLPTPVFLGFPCGSAGKESACNVGNLGSIPGLGRSPGEGKGYPLSYSGLENSMDCIVHGVAKSRTRLSDFHFQLVSTNLILLFYLSPPCLSFFFLILFIFKLYITVLVLPNIKMNPPQVYMCSPS